MVELTDVHGYSDDLRSREMSSADEESSVGELKKEKSAMDCIEVIELNRHNFTSIWPYLLICVKSADFIGVDLELSGLGRGIHAKNMEQRYLAIKDAAQTRSVLSLGISTLKLKKKNEKKKRLQYEAQVFNILTLSDKPFTIEPDALKFLSNHDFDFNRLIQTGIAFGSQNCPMRSLFREIFATSASLCLHNGIVDLAFIYHHFFQIPLPSTFDEFSSRLHDLFPSDYLPIVDSKYLAEYHSRLPASYLEYVFRRSQGDNVIERQNRRFHVKIDFPSTTNLMKSLQSAIDKVDYSLPDNFPFHPVPVDLGSHICESYGNHGFCHAHRKMACNKLHNVDFVIDLQRIREQKNRFKRKRRYNNVIVESMADENREEEKLWMETKFDNQLKVKDLDAAWRNRLTVAGCHRAGVDAFMTAFSVVYQQRLELFRNNCVAEQHVNKLPLSGKDAPMTIRKATKLAMDGQLVVTEDAIAHVKAIDELEIQRNRVREMAANAAGL